MRDLEPSEISDYACEDADITLQLKNIFEKEIKKPHLKDLFYDMEMPLVEVLMEMEEEGIAIDSKALAEYSKELDSTLIDLDSQIKVAKMYKEGIGTDKDISKSDYWLKKIEESKTKSQ